jgi:prepilin-type N-terminal cleavage/methylation domain-containing protein
VTRLRRIRRDQRGFTLIELTTTMALLGIFLAAVALVLGGAIRNSSAVEDQAAVQSNARAALDVMAGEIRQGYFDSTSTFSSGATWIKSGMTSTTFTFYTPDRVSPFHLRVVSYRLQNGELQRAFATSTTTGTGPWLVGATNLNAVSVGTYRTVVDSVVTSGSNVSSFSFLDSNDNATTTPANVVNMRIKLVVSPRGSQGRTSTYVVKTGPRL